MTPGIFGTAGFPLVLVGRSLGTCLPNTLSKISEYLDAVPGHGESTNSQDDSDLDGDQSPTVLLQKNGRWSLRIAKKGCDHRENGHDKHARSWQKQAKQ